MSAGTVCSIFAETMGCELVKTGRYWYFVKLRRKTDFCFHRSSWLAKMLLLQRLAMNLTIKRNFRQHKKSHSLHTRL